MIFPPETAGSSDIFSYSTAVLHLALIWPITTRFLLKQSNTQWSLGRTERSKELTNLAGPFLESLRTVGKVYPVGNMQASKLE
jgi:hypothetical protein